MCPMCDERNNPNERIEKLLKDNEFKDESLEIWTEALEELSEIEDAFKTNGKPDIQGKTVLDVGTDAVKPLYIALRYNPSKIVGISDFFRPFVSDIELKSKILTDTQIRFYTCSLFDEATFDRIRGKENILGKFNFVLVSKTLHHLRTDKCIEKHECPESEESCKYGFNTEFIFNKLLSFGERVIVYESIDDSTEEDDEEDADKVRGRGSYFRKNDMLQILTDLTDSGKYRLRFIRPQIFLEQLPGFILHPRKIAKFNSELKQGINKFKECFQILRIITVLGWKLNKQTAKLAT
jgi:hypothetical protein